MALNSTAASRTGLLSSGRRRGVVSGRVLDDEPAEPVHADSDQVGDRVLGLDQHADLVEQELEC